MAVNQNCFQIDRRSRKKASGNPRRRQSASLGRSLNQRGQIVVEYVLLLVIAVSIVALISRSMVSQRPGETGFVIGVWQDVLAAIGSDKADDVKTSGKSK